MKCPCLRKKKMSFIQSSFDGQLQQEIIQVIQEGKPKDSVVVFDIDSTILKYDQQQQCFANHVTVGLTLYKKVFEKGYDIHLVTAREESFRKDTEKQLECMGYFQYKSLKMRPLDNRSIEATSRCKQDARNKIMIETEKNILLNVGDQWSDHFVLTKPMNYLDSFYIFFKRYQEDVQWSLKLPA